MMTETWYTSELGVLKLPGYKSHFLNRRGKKGGGLTLMVQDRFESELLSNYSLITDD